MYRIEKNGSFIEYRDTPWDTKVLNKESNEITKLHIEKYDHLDEMLIEFEGLCAKTKIIFTNCRCNASDLGMRRILSKYGYYFTEVSYEVKALISNIRFSDSRDILLHGIEEVGQHMKEQICTLTTTNFEYGRFFEDPKIGIWTAKKRNENWVQQLFDEKTGLLYAAKGLDLIGFMFFHQSGPTVQFTLGGMNPKYSHLAVDFWQNLFKHFDIRDSKFITSIISASNVSVLNLYTHFNFKVIHAFAGYHKFRGQYDQ